ncbi:MAG: ATP-binding protein [bacterium]
MGNVDWQSLVEIRDRLVEYSGDAENFIEKIAERLEKKSPLTLLKDVEEHPEGLLAVRQTPAGKLCISGPEEPGPELRQLADWFLDWLGEKYLDLQQQAEKDKQAEFLIELNRLLMGLKSPRRLMDSIAQYFEEYFSLQVAGIWLNKEETFVQLYRKEGIAKFQPPERYLFKNDETGKWRRDPFVHRDNCWLVIGDEEGLAGLIAFSNPEQVFTREKMIRSLIPLMSIYLRRMERSITTGRHELYEIGDTETLSKEQFETSQGLEEVWQTIVETISNMFECDACRLFLQDKPGQLTLKAEFPSGENTGSSVKIEEDPLIKSVIRDEKAVLINNVPDHEQTVRSPGGVRSFLAIPFRYQGEVMGTINLSSETADMYTRDDLDKLTHFCDNLATVYHVTAEFANLTGYVDNLLANLPVGVIDIDIDSKNVFLNQTAQEILKIDGEGINYDHFLNQLEENMQAEELHQFISRQFSRPGEEVARVEVKTDDASPRHLSVSSTAIEDINGKETGLLFVLTDITEQHLLNKQVNRQERLAALGELASSLAHEIKNPLTSIIGFAQLIPQRSEDQEFIEKMARIVGKESERLNSLVENLLSFGRPQVGNRLEVELDGLIEDITILTGKKLEKKNVDLSIDISDDLVVYGDPVKLKQIFLNLVLNSIDAMPDGGQLEINGERNNDYSTINVKDNGVGMNDEEINKIFNPFFTTKEEGTGLGLAITHRIIEEHGGEIKVASEPGEGTEMTVKLPADEKAVPPEGEVTDGGKN